VGSVSGWQAEERLDRFCRLRDGEDAREQARAEVQTQARASVMQEATLEQARSLIADGCEKARSTLFVSFSRCCAASPTRAGQRMKRRDYVKPLIRSESERSS
jgi:hypothetical protein